MMANIHIAKSLKANYNLTTDKLSFEIRNFEIKVQCIFYFLLFIAMTGSLNSLNYGKNLNDGEPDTTRK